MYQLFGVVLHVLQYFSNGLALYNAVYRVSVVGNAYVHGVCVAEKVVHVAEYFLVCPYEEHSHVVVFPVAQPVQRHVGCLLHVVYVFGDFTVAVAGDVLQCYATVGLFVEPLDWHHGEELVESPRIGQALKQGEIAEVFVG